LFFGAGFTSILVLLLNIAPSPLSLGIFFLLLPGGVPVAILSRSNELGPPLAVMAGNALAYAAIAYIAISTYWRSSSAVTVRRVTVRMALAAVILLGLACIPALNPLWPRGMLELKKQESELQTAFPLGVELNHSRTVLLSRGIQFREETEPSGAVVLERKDKKLTAAEGDRVLSARFQTSASVVPCGYDMEIVLLFGRDDKLREQYVHRLRVCP
jgi:hypothetical protein